MSAQTIRRIADEAEEQTRAMASTLRRLANERPANEVLKIVAETAGLILENAALRATHVDRAVGDARAEEFRSDATRSGSRRRPAYGRVTRRSTTSTVSRLRWMPGLPSAGPKPGRGRAPR